MNWVDVGWTMAAVCLGCGVCFSSFFFFRWGPNVQARKRISDRFDFLGIFVKKMSLARKHSI